MSRLFQTKHVSGLLITLVLVLGVAVVSLVELAADEYVLETLIVSLCMLLGARCVNDETMPWGPSLEGAGPDPSARDLSSDREERRPSPRASARLHSKLQLFANQGNLPEAKRCFERIQAEAKPTVRTFNIILSACIKCSGCIEAEQWFERMEEAQVVPNQASYSILVSGWARAGAPGLAWRWLEKMQESGSEPTAGCFLSLLVAECKKGQLHQAEAILEDLTRQFPNARLQATTVLLDACAKHGDLEGAERLMQSIASEASVVSFGAMLDACAKAKDPQRALRWHETMLARGLRPNNTTCTALAVALARAGDFAQALGALEAMEDFGLQGDAVAYTCLLDACAKARENLYAQKVFALMKRRGVQPNILTYTSLARAQGNCGRWDKVEELAREMRANYGIRMNDFFLYALLLAYAFGRPRQTEKAEAAFLFYVKEEQVPINKYIISGLSRAVGSQRAKELVYMTGYKENSLI